MISKIMLHESIVQPWPDDETMLHDFFDNAAG